MLNKKEHGSSIPGPCRVKERDTFRSKIRMPPFIDPLRDPPVGYIIKRLSGYSLTAFRVLRICLLISCQFRDSVDACAPVRSIDCSSRLARIVPSSTSSRFAV